MNCFESVKLRATGALVPHVPHVFRVLVPHVSCALRASCHRYCLVSGASCLTCSRVPLVLRALAPHVSDVLRVLGLLVPRTLHAPVLFFPHLLHVFQA